MDSIASMIESLEHQLLDLGVRSSPERVGDLLSADFREFGKSGHIWSREEIIAAMATERHPLRYRLEDLTVKRLGEDAALACYALHVAGSGGTETKALRSSVWQREPDGKWRLLFHQGTKSE
jgi:hypothetical protein